MNQSFYENTKRSLERSNSFSNGSIVANIRLQTISNDGLKTRYNYCNNDDGNFCESSRNTKKTLSKNYSSLIIRNKDLKDLKNVPLESKINYSKNFDKTNELLDINNLNLNTLEIFLDKKKKEMPEQYNDNYINFIKNYFALTLSQKQNNNSNNNGHGKNIFLNSSKKQNTNNNHDNINYIRKKKNNAIKINNLDYY